MDEIIVISVGGSLIVPGEIDNKFLSEFRSLVLRFIDKGKRFIIICGGGTTARIYQTTAKSVFQIDNEDADWLGIHATRINAHLLRTIFKDLAHPRIIKDPNETVEFNEKVLFAAGWKPGFSTDYDAVILAKNFRIKKVINLTNIDYVCDKDPNNFEDSRPIKSIDWEGFRKLLPTEWDPGLNAPFDPIAAKEAHVLGLEVVIMNGQKLENLENYLEGKDFAGTVVK